MPPRKKPKQAPKPAETFVPDASLCFIKRIPDDTLSSIFKIAEAEYRAEHGPRILTSWTHAYYFCRVNSVWRSVAFKTPELWTCINVQSPKSLKRGTAWVGHAGRQSLDVKVVTKWPDASFEAVMDVFGAHLDHTRNLAIDTRGEQSSRGKRFFWPNGITSLRTLELGVVFETVSQAADVLRSCPQLRELNMSGCTLQKKGPKDADVAAIHLPGLRIAHFSCDDLMVCIVPQLRIPKSAKISFDGEPANTLKVNYYDFSVDSDDLFPCLRNLPQITALSFEEVLWPAQVVTFLCTPDADGFFPCPQLKKLEFHSCVDFYGSFMEYEARYRGVEGRVCTLPPPLKLLLVDTCPFLDDHSEAKRMFREFGTEFAFFNDTELHPVEWESDVCSERSHSRCHHAKPGPAESDATTTDNEAEDSQGD